MYISVLLTTYNSPEWLEKVLWGLRRQTDRDFEIVVADDGSTEETRRVIDGFRSEAPGPVQHVWQEDRGFRKCRALNKALLASKGDYIVVTDGDCIPRHDFVAVHREHAELGRFLSGGYFKLPAETSQRITRADIDSGDCFRIEWLRAHGVPRSRKLTKLTASPFRAAIYNALTPTRRTWNGHNASCWKSDALRVNGFDERMRYGGLDREFGERLRNAGIKGKQIRYRAICLHLHHERAYANEADRLRNRAIREVTRAGDVVETPAGIRQHSGGESD